jgi:hypothetical protein
VCSKDLSLRVECMSGYCIADIIYIEIKLPCFSLCSDDVMKGIDADDFTSRRNVHIFIDVADS